MTISSQTYSRRTDDITVIKWESGSNGTEEMVYLQNDLGMEWNVTLETWRTISCTDGTSEFSFDRGDYAAKDSDGVWHKLSPAQLKLFFQPA